ncbi:MAG: zinc ribbon domain-containing protein [Promethearchaeota archaeon]
MGWKRVIGSGCLGMLCLIPMAWISFRFFNLTSLITGGLIENLEDALGEIPGFIGGGAGGVIEILVGAFIGLALIFLFPIHWCIFYRPDDVLLVIAVTIPWILCCVITSGLFAHSPKGGIHTSLAIGIGYAIPLSLIYFVLVAFVPFGPIIIDAIADGLTDLPYILAVLTAILEGCLVGAVFGGFVGSLKYKPEGRKEKKVKKMKVKEEEGPIEMFPPSQEIETPAPVTSKDIYCIMCGAKLKAEDTFCTNCGAKRT